MSQNRPHDNGGYSGRRIDLNRVVLPRAQTGVRRPPPQPQQQPPQQQPPQQQPPQQH